jgi:NAD(P)-dependent dehydrogenase (short-subunit alcohol dehydrogenase family)
MQLLKDDVVLVTGGGAGLGLGVARQCMIEGAQVVIMDVSEDRVRALSAEFGSKVLVLRGDVTKQDDLHACRDAIVARYGKLDSLIGVQGIFDGNVRLNEIPSERIDELFDEVFHVNVKGYILSARIFYELLRDSSGSIVLTTSTAAYAADGGGLIYTASKGAIRSLVGQLAFEFAPNVRVNAVAPAAIANSQLRGPRTLGLEEQKQSDIPKEVFLSMFRSLSLMQDLPMPEDYGHLYTLLASRHNKVMTGQTVIADQGLLNRSILSAR